MATIFDASMVYALHVERAPDGGFLVIDGRRDMDGGGNFRGIRLACTSMDEALKYIKRKLETDHAAKAKASGLTPDR